MARNQLTVEKMPASTMLEVITSMVIIVLVFGIAMMIYSNVTRFSLSAKQVQAQAVLQRTITIADRSKGSYNATLTSGDFIIEQSVKPYNSDGSLLDIDVIAYDSNRIKLAELEKVTPREDD